MVQANYYPSQQQIDDLTARSFDLHHEDTRQALELSLQARELSLKVDYQLGFATSLYLISLCSYILGVEEDVLDILQQALNLFQTLGDKRGEANSYNLMGNMSHRRGLADDAVRYYHKSLQIRREAGDKAGEAGSLNNIGIVYSETSRLPEAMEYLFESLNIAEAFSFTSNISYALLNIAQVFVLIGDRHKAITYFEKSLEINKNTHDRALDCTALTELGRVYATLKNHESAMQCLSRALEISRQTGNYHDQGLTHLGIGLALLENGQYVLAEEKLRLALSIMEKANAPASQGEALSLLGRNCLLQEKYDEAITFLHRSLELSEKTKIAEQVKKNHELLAKVYEATNDYEQAYHHYRSYHNIWETLYSHDFERRIHAILARVELERAQREAESHRLKNRELSEALNEVKRSEDEKAQILQQLETQAKVLEQLAREDGLTRISNRRWLDIQLYQEFERARRFNHPFTIAMIDLDDFKSINDRFSHLSGDEVLRQIAKLMRTSCRVVDVVGRYGGEEFMLILVETTLAQAFDICSGMLDSFRNFPWTSVHPQLNVVTASIGLSSNLGFSSALDMTAEADRQLYRAKRSGKNQICVPDR